MRNKDFIASVACGTLVSTLVNFSVADAIKTAIFAGIGALVSFFVTLIMRQLTRKFEK
ncbi:hypothetical protein GS399_03205 [Pedobacter sp. HMF7647]|uniref:Uncharacterized protein n=1 Tax=Hufsiella arboris TaxID=2695275 RepID=A0A7K1Y5W0_9SPHI|nr:hypothetical protein [Hufsiella arboris]MXV49966.1 hypothetical protein [Hufsiella arboris]